jgi:hypothetical protein
MAGSINNTNRLIARKQFIGNGCATYASPNHHDVMVLGFGHQQILVMRVFNCLMN